MDLRPATGADAELLLAWRNDPDTVAWSRSPDPVSRPDHVRWLDAVLADPDRLLLIAEADGPVGTVRFDRDGDAWEVSITVAPVRRGQGLALPILATAEATLEAGTSLLAWVHRDNKASLALFERAGYVCEPSDAEWLRWTKRV
jgi:RimJ/RimL family protein N-acetyltransferase